MRPGPRMSIACSLISRSTWSRDPPYGVRVEPRSKNAMAAGLSSFETTHHPRLNVGTPPREESNLHPEVAGQGQAAGQRLPFRTRIPSPAPCLVRQHGAGPSAEVTPFTCGAGIRNCGNYPPVLKQVGLYYSQAIIWDKMHPVLTRKDYMGDHEWCFYGWKEGAAHRFFGPNNATDLWAVKKVHPQSHAPSHREAGRVGGTGPDLFLQARRERFDLFGGSGSTLIAAERTGRTAFLMEVDELYVRCDRPSLGRVHRQEGRAGEGLGMRAGAARPEPWPSGEEKRGRSIV